MSLGLILVILLLGGFSGRFGGYGYGFGHGGVGVTSFLGFSGLQLSDAEKATITEMKKALGH